MKTSVQPSGLQRSGFLLSIMLVMSLMSCTSTSVKDTAVAGDDALPPKADLTYEQKLDRYSAGDKEYAGFYNAFEYRATILNTPVRDLLLQKRAAYFQWDDAKIAQEKEKSHQELSTQTIMFVSFFTPERLNDNLADRKTIWRTYIDAGGRRYEGKVTRIRLLLAELSTLYPYHTRWNSPYKFEFPVPTTAIETQDVTLTITGPLGSRSVTFPAIR